jgi:hypothetical protein
MDRKEHLPAVKISVREDKCWGSSVLPTSSGVFRAEANAGMLRRYNGTVPFTRIARLLKLRFYIDPATGLPHIYNHQVNEEDVMEILEEPGEDRAGSDGSRVALGQTSVGRYLRVIYVPDQDRRSIFVITAYEPTGKPLEEALRA